MINVGLSWSSVMATLFMPTQPVLAQVNFLGNFSSLLGVALAASGIGLYALRSVRPNLARDHDIFFSAVALLCGGILFFQGWRQDPILQFGQFLMTGSAIFFAFESIRLRGVTTEQAKRSTPVVDDDRPVSRVYRAELDELAPVDERPTTRRIRGSRDVRSAQLEEDYDDDIRRRSSSRSGSDRLSPGSDRPRSSSSTSRRRPSSSRPEGRLPDRGDFSAWDDEGLDRGSDYDRSERSSSRSSSRPTRSSSSSSSRTRRPRPSQGPSRQDYDSRSASDYVDYQPVDDYEDPDNIGNFD